MSKQEVEAPERLRNPPLRFASVKGAREHIKANGLRVTNHIAHTHGVRINVVDAKGKPRTIVIERSKADGNDG